MHLSSEVFVILAALVSKVRVQDVSATIVGCAEVGCPIANDGTTTAQCTVSNKTFTTIGLARIPSLPSSLAGLSWTEGVAVSTNSSGWRTFDKTFYLGVPASSVENLSATQGCAVFFTEVSNSVQFKGATVETAVGTCADAMTSQCVGTLIERAEGVDVGGLSTEAACARLQTQFQTTLDSECQSFATGSNWTGISVKPLSGQGAPTPLTAAQNSTSNCWPVLPKSDNLTVIYSMPTSGSSSVDDLIANFYDITPILTVFFDGNNSSLLGGSQAQMTCMKTVGPNSAANETQDSGGSETSSSGEASFRNFAIRIEVLFMCLLSSLFMFF